MKNYSLVTLLLSCFFSACAKYPAVTPRGENWARKIEIAGVQNFHEVSPDLFRSEQPTAEGMNQLSQLGIKTVVSLRAFHTDERFLKGTDLGYEQIFFETWQPKESELIQFLKIATEPAKTPVLVHCLHGSDRTGAMCAGYRIVVQGWSKEAAIAEMKGGGYGHHKILANLSRWIRGLDVEKIREAVAEPQRKRRERS